MNEPTLCMNVWGREGWGSISFATKEIRTPKATSNKSTLSDPTPKKKSEKSKRSLWKKTHKAKDYYNTISKLWTDDQRICQDEGNKEATTLILLYFGSLLQWMNEWMPGKFWWVCLQMIDSNHLWCSSLLLKNWNFGSAISFTPTYPVPYCHRWVGCSQSLPFPKREPAGQFRVCKTPGWLACWLMAIVNNWKNWVLDPIPVHGSQ